MKLVSYNILFGGQNEDGPDRLQDLISTIQELSPDVIGIQEANRLGDNDQTLLKAWAEQLGCTYVDNSRGWQTLRSLGNFSVALFSKIGGRTESRNDDAFKNGALHSIIPSSIGDISVMTAHPRADTDDDRVEEIERLIVMQEPYEYKILLGDMNSLSPDDPYDTEVVSDFNDIQVRKFTKDGKLQFKVMTLLKEKGYHDLAVVHRAQEENTIPTKHGNYDRAHVTPMRLDYILVSPPLVPHVRSFGVVKNDRTDRASDHYPVMCEFDDSLFQV